MSQLEFDESTARQLEVLYGTRDVLRRRQLVREALGVAPGRTRPGRGLRTWLLRRRAA